MYRHKPLPLYLQLQLFKNQRESQHHIKEAISEESEINLNRKYVLQNGKNLVL